MAPQAACGDEKALLAMEATEEAAGAPTAAGIATAPPEPRAPPALRAAVAVAAWIALGGAAALAAAAVEPRAWAAPGRGAAARAGVADASQLYVAGGYVGGTAVVAGSAPAGATYVVPQTATVHSFSTVPQPDPVIVPGQGDVYHGGQAVVQPSNPGYGNPGYGVTYGSGGVIVVHSHSAWFGWPLWVWIFVDGLVILGVFALLYYCCMYPRVSPYAYAKTGWWA